jgi:hypothetical protein
LRDIATGFTGAPGLAFSQNAGLALGNRGTPNDEIRE